MHKSINAERHNVEHLPVSKLKTIKPLQVLKLNTECLHICKSLRH